MSDSKTDPDTMNPDVIPKNDLNMGRAVAGEREGQAAVLRTDVTDRDLVDLMVVRHEEKLHKHAQETDKNIENKNKELVDAVEALNEVCAKAAHDRWHKDASAVATSLNRLKKGEVKLRIDSGYQEEGSSIVLERSQQTRYLDRKDKVDNSSVVAHIRIYIGDVSSPIVQVPGLSCGPTDEVRAAHAAKNKVHAELVQLEKHAQEMRNQLRELPYAERRLRARLTQQKIDKADKGLNTEIESYLDQLSDEIPEMPKIEGG